MSISSNGLNSRVAPGGSRRTSRTTRGRLLGVCGVALVLLLTVSGRSARAAQPQTPEGSGAPVASEAQTVSESPAVSGAGESQTDALHAALSDPATSTEELAYRLVPLTKTELESLASEWQGILQSKTMEFAERQAQVARDPTAATEESFHAIAASLEEREGVLERFTMVVNALEAKAGDAALVAELRAYRDSIVVSETVLASPRAIGEYAVKWITRPDGGLAIAKDIGIVILALLALIVLSRFIQRLAQRWFGRALNASKLLQAFLVRTVYWLVLVVGLLLVLAALGVNVTPLFAMIGGASFILAFAFQDTLGNLASGLMIMINRPFDEGDLVVVAGVTGKVRSVSIVATTVVTPDNQVIVIPNKNVWGDVITNVTASDTRRVDMVFGISYEDSMPEAQGIIEAIVKDHPLVLEDPEPVIRVHELADSSVNFVCRPWAKTDDYWVVYWDLTQQVKEAFDNAGISIPYPQQDVHFTTSPV